PIIRMTLKQRLNFNVSRLGTNPDNPDAEDLYSKVITEIVGRLREFQAEPDKKGIKHFDQYVRRVAVNVCHGYLRLKAPQRYYLKGNLRYLLDSHREFKIWRDASNSLLCGLASWPQKKTAGISRLDNEQMEGLLEQCNRNLAGESLQDANLGKIVAEIFSFVGEPMEFDALVDIVAELQGTKDRPIESLDDYDPDQIRQIAGSAPRSDELLEERERIREIWEELRRLPLQQRLAICLRFEDKDVDDVWSMIWCAGVCTPRRIAEEFGMSLEKLAELWLNIPMSNADIAKELGVRKQQVAQWRSRGWKKLKHLIGGRKKK
ncbi:MAG: sigma-70 family RNA polymerase sigma factor, partial [Acidobacteria bacterium]|nr:sigma-70 family RNA polymerase sigma factor [Acidobacteriota bacterium]